MEELDLMTVRKGRIYDLYQFLGHLSPTNFAVTYGVLVENDTNTCGIFIKGGNPSSSERSLS